MVHNHPLWALKRNLLKPSYIHFSQELFSKWVSRTFTYNGINTAVRTNCGAALINGVVVDDPLFNLSGIEDSEAVKTAASFVLLQLIHVITRKDVSSPFRGDTIFGFI